VYEYYIKINIYSEKYAEGHGILEFSTDKAGQDVTPMNLKFDDEAIQNRGSTLNSISGEYLYPYIFFYLSLILNKYFLCVNNDKYKI